MEELKSWNKMSEDQRKKAKAALNKSHMSMLLAVVIFMVGLFGSNLLGTILGRLVMEDPDPTAWQTYCFLVALLNTLFMGRYFHGKIKEIDAKLKSELQVINKTNS